MEYMVLWLSVECKCESFIACGMDGAVTHSLFLHEGIGKWMGLMGGIWEFSAKLMHMYSWNHEVFIWLNHFGVNNYIFSFDLIPELIWCRQLVLLINGDRDFVHSSYIYMDDYASITTALCLASGVCSALVTAVLYAISWCIGVYITVLPILHMKTICILTLCYHCLSFFSLALAAS